MRADELRFEPDALRSQQLAQELVRHAEGFFGETVRAAPVLVADHDKGVSGVAQFEQCGNHLGHQPQFLQAVDLEIGGFFDQRAVAVDEQYSLAHAAAPAAVATPRINLSFCSGVPTEMRTQFANAGCERGSRMINPAPVAAVSTRSASTHS